MTDVASGTAISGVVRATAALAGSLRPPADKSVAHRALLFNAMGRGSAEIILQRPGEDVLSMAGALRSLGAVGSIDRGDEDSTRVLVRGGGTSDVACLPGRGGETLDCGNAGTAMRLLTGALAGRPGTATLFGDDSLSSRPMERVAVPLRRVGANVVTTDGHAPLVVHGRRPLTAVDHQLTVASAQVVGCLTLAALNAEGTTTITVPGPTRDHTERMLTWLGASVRREGFVTTVVGPTSFAARSVTVPGDISSAAAWLVAAAIHPSADVTIESVGLNPSRTGIIDVLREMGADIEVEPDTSHEAGPEPVGRITVRGGRRLSAIDLSGDRVAHIIDELPLIGVAMAAAGGRSELRDARELRVKESDRIALVVENLRAAGARAEEREDGWVVSRGVPREASIRTAGDHRIAMSFAIAALTGVVGTVHIDDPHSVAISYPAFWADMESLVR